MLKSCQRIEKKNSNTKVTVVPFVVCALETAPNDLKMWLEEVEIRVTIDNIQPDKIGLNIQKNPVKDHKLKLTGKIFNRLSQNAPKLNYFSYHA